MIASIFLPPFGQLRTDGSPWLQASCPVSCDSWVPLPAAAVRSCRQPLHAPQHPRPHQHGLRWIDPRPLIFTIHRWQLERGWGGGGRWLREWTTRCYGVSGSETDIRVYKKLIYMVDPHSFFCGSRSRVFWSWKESKKDCSKAVCWSRNRHFKGGSGAGARADILVGRKQEPEPTFSGGSGSFLKER